MTPKLCSPRWRSLSLLELVIAFGILVVVLLSVLSFVISAGRAQRLQSEHELARGLALGKLGDLRARLHQSPWTGTQDVADAFDDLLNNVDPKGETIGNWNADSSQPGVAIRELDVIIRGTESDADAALGTTGVLRGTMRIEASTHEQNLLGLTEIDIDADGTLAEGTAIPVAEVRVLPVRITVSWTSDVGDQTETITGLLY